MVRDRTAFLMDPRPGALLGAVALAFVGAAMSGTEPQAATSYYGRPVVKAPAWRLGGGCSHAGDGVRVHGPWAALRKGRGGRYSVAANALTAVGVFLVGGAGRGCAKAVAGSGALLVGSLCTRFAVYHAGFQSARDRRATV
jgi:hypothetical protein